MFKRLRSMDAKKSSGEKMSLSQIFVNISADICEIGRLRSLNDWCHKAISKGVMELNLSKIANLTFIGDCEKTEVIGKRQYWRLFE